jgi:phosphoenolpyruvate synthase/pyruvate phosphate dikinase
MTKKIFVLQMLDVLKNKRALAGDFMKYINIGAMNNEAVNALAELLRDMARFMSDDFKKHRLEQVAEMLDRLKTKELEEMALDQREAENILASL